MGLGYTRFVIEQAVRIAGDTMTGLLTLAAGALINPGQKLSWGTDLELTRAAAGCLAVSDGATVLGQVREMLVAAVQINLNDNVNKQTLFTCPNGRSFYPTKIIEAGPSAALAAGTAWGYGRDANATDWRAPAALGAYFTATTKVHHNFVSTTAAFEVVAANEIFGAKVTVPEVRTIYIYVFGYLI